MNLRCALSRPLVIRSLRTDCKRRAFILTYLITHKLLTFQKSAWCSFGRSFLEMHDGDEEIRPTDSNFFISSIKAEESRESLFKRVLAFTMPKKFSAPQLLMMTTTSHLTYSYSTKCIDQPNLKNKSVRK